MTNIEQLVSEFRDYVNDPPIQSQPRGDRGRWLRICSSMDAIEDAELAIAAYMKSEYPDASGDLYLALYGLLQSLIIQQDAAKELLQSLGIDIHWEDFLRLKDIRAIRNRALHPTEYKSGRKTMRSIKHIFLVRVALRKKSFELHETIPDASTEFQVYDTMDIIQDQALEIEKALRQGLQELRTRD
ncbi:MAG TPA: hypothetical protein VMR52_12540 [Dehalococcoidia bacterium]|nr:hypothetical protein [Dehalococcoidia bacterium]